MSEDKKKNCLWCGQEFIAKSSVKKYCSKNCRASKWRHDNMDRVHEIQNRYEDRCRAEEKQGKLSKKQNLAERRGKKRERTYSQLAEVRQMIRDYKMKIGCQRCGYNDHYSALQFHHQPGFVKKLNVCNAKTAKQFRSEAKKCIILCANCHAIQNHKDMVTKFRKKIKGFKALLFFL